MLKLKKNQKGEAYLMITILDSDTGQVFNIVHKEVEDMAKLTAMSKYLLTINVIPSKYGINLKIENIGDKTGEI